MDPESYEYSDYMGPRFFDSYEADRSKALEPIERRLSNLPASGNSREWDGLLEALTISDPGPAVTHLPTFDCFSRSEGADSSNSERVPDPYANHRFETVCILAELLGYPGDTPPDGESAKTWLNRFTKRYEVSKHLLTEYDSEMCQLTEKPAPLIAYPMLSLVALISYSRTDNLKYLNVALKLGDLVSSRRDSLHEPGTLAFAHLSLNIERAAIEELAALKGVEL